MILHICNILINMLGSWLTDVESETVLATANPASLMMEWVSLLTAVYTVAKLKMEYVQLVLFVS